jgi:uncharacterized membrane protein
MQDAVQMGELFFTRYLVKFSQMNRPIISIKAEPIDKYLIIATWLGLILLISIPLFYFNALPERIPSHFDGGGNVNQMGGKMTIWLLPLIGILTVGFMKILAKQPHSFNYLQKITAENAAKQYLYAIRLMNVIQAFIVFSFCFITYQNIQIALGNRDGLSAYFLPVFMSVLIGIIGYYIYVAKKK